MILTVNLQEHSYPIYIESNALAHIKDFLNPDRHYALITDDGVPEQWVQLVLKQLNHVALIRIQQGEENKNIETWKRCLQQCIEAGLNRSSAIIALGGGVVGDLAGFVAASFMRGIDFYNIPTTVLAQVDSSVGGKVAVDLDGCKNIVGAFYQPKAVIIDPQVLFTLPTRQISNGLVEALKMGIILDEKLLEAFEQEDLDLTWIISRSIDLKRQIVEEDEKEQGSRALLNFGHTIGHAIESACDLNGLLHGECVGHGMLYFLEDPQLKERVLQILNQLQIPDLPEISPQMILDYMKHDKKGRGDGVLCVKVQEPGCAYLEWTSFGQLARKIGAEYEE